MNKSAALALVLIAGFAAWRGAQAAAYSDADINEGGDIFSLDPFGWMSDNADNAPEFSDNGVGVDSVPHYGEGDSMGAWRVNEYPKYSSAIRDAEIRNSIPIDLYARLLAKESSYKRDIIEGAKRSPVGATGIAQFMPRTGQEMGLVEYAADNQTIVRDDRLNPWKSIEAGARYLRRMFNLFGNWQDALRAYNWGPGNVAKWKRGEIQAIPNETADYVARITADVPVA